MNKIAYVYIPVPKNECNYHILQKLIILKKWKNTEYKVPLKWGYSSLLHTHTHTHIVSDQ